MQAVVARFAAYGSFFPGVALALLVAFAATFVAEHNGGPQLLYALFFGIAFHFLSADAKCQPGIDFAAKTLLRFGVALLGARVTLGHIGSLGWTPMIVVCAGVAATLACGTLCARALGRTREEGLLSGGAVAICGASAALAIASVLPQSKDNERLTLLTVVGVTGLSTLAMIFYPTLAGALGLDARHAGIFLGGTIHDVAQVVGAGYTVATEAGDVATFVKLLRVALLVPVVVGLALLYRARRERAAGASAAPLVPLFLLGFAALVAVNSAGWIPARAGAALADLSRWCLVTAIAALGVKTSFQSLAALGWRPVALLAINTAFLAALVLALLWALAG